MNKGKQLVYKWCHTYDTFSFALREEAERVHKLNSAHGKQITWGELRNQIDAMDYNYLKNTYHEMDEITDDGSLIDWTKVEDWWGVYYPSWLFTLMEDIIPMEILEKHSHRQDVLEDSTYFEIASHNLVPFIIDLEKAGFEVNPTDDLDFDP